MRTTGTQKEKVCKREFSNIMQGEVYVRFPERVVGTQRVKQYNVLREVPYANGIREELVAVDYPITPESVNSYADSADYHTNPEVIRQATPRQNLGDITEVQQMLRNDMSQMQAMVASAQETLKKIENYQAKTATKVVNNEKAGEENNG